MAANPVAWTGFHVSAYDSKTVSAIKDSHLLELAGTILESSQPLGMSYRLLKVIGEGAQGVVFLAQRSSETELAVVKVLRPRAVRDLGGLGSMAITKEVAALQRLARTQPGTHHVVQFLDSGLLRIRDSALELPWIAVEYIDGGTEGTTLRARVRTSIERSSTGFSAGRTKRAVDCMVGGMSAMHEVGVLHRDLNPGNVLCTGQGDGELLKLADFGLARVSSASTYGNVLLGTPGYCAPEQSFPDTVGVGPYSDVFSLACCVFFILTGEAYFSAPTIPEMLVAVYSSKRRCLLDSATLCPELRANASLCRDLDGVLVRATAADPRKRPQTAAEFSQVAAVILSDIRTESATALASLSPPQ